MTKLRLIHPIYLDVPMLASFSAAIQGGLSLGSEITKETEITKSRSTNLGSKIGLNSLFGTLFDASVEGNLSGARANRDQEVLKESRQHTEASIAILLYDHLLNNEGYIIKPENAKQLSKTEPGELVEVAGVLYKNAVDSVIDYLDAISILSRMGETPPPTKGKKQASKSMIDKMRDALDEDRRRTPISNVLLRCSEPSDINVVVTLRTDNLRDLTLSELHKNSVRVVGKVTRVVQEGQTMSAFENYGMALIKPNMLEQTFKEVAAPEETVVEFSDVVIEGPAVQILPLMVYV